MVSLKDGIAIQAVSSHEYSAYFHDKWCIGSGELVPSQNSCHTQSLTTDIQVPHGGYVTSCFMQVAKTHFSTTLSQQNQRHTIALHLEFVRRTEAGPATFLVRDVKLGRLTSIIHISLFQKGREEVLGYFIHANISLESGPSFATDWRLAPPPAPASIPALAAGTDPHWAEQKAMPFPEFRKASQNVRFFFPRHDGQPHKGSSIVDEWIALQSGEKFTNVSLGMVVDMFPQIIERFRDNEAGSYAVAPKEKENSPPTTDTEAGLRKKGMAKFWYPTLLLNVDIKKALPEEGIDWLFLRATAKQIKNGRFDLEIVVLDESGDVVALSHMSVWSCPQNETWPSAGQKRRIQSCKAGRISNSYLYVRVCAEKASQEPNLKTTTLCLYRWLASAARTLTTGCVEELLSHNVQGN